MVQNVVTNEEMNSEYSRPALRIITTDGAECPAAPSIGVSQSQDNVIVLKIHTAATLTDVRNAARSRRIVDRVFDFAMISLAATSAVAGGIALITMSHI